MPSQDFPASINKEDAEKQPGPGRPGRRSSGHLAATGIASTMLILISLLTVGSSFILRAAPSGPRLVRPLRG